ncbi:Holliday junction resolvase RuvX [Promicromonospora soli]|uniref:Putative pre-16S rRNA nuclease n=1 Tax=Promicromonospora soli TaxID=2035533 RepID=A0A919G4U8_9MICO|nr:Holliday junction resolvase RuvX [Promicromonospora soli]GHH77916.1 putative pre-16S rRNA nuclease [Promicromonospora soli]
MAALPQAQQPPDDARPGLPRGARLGVDVGMARIGLAASDPDGLVATPVETVPRVLATPGKQGGSTGKQTGSQTGSQTGRQTGSQAGRSAQGTTADVARIVAEAAERFAAVVYVGLPRHLSGKEGAATADAREFAARLVVALAATGERAEVRLVDERMTTVSAHQALHAAGRKTKKHRSVIDQAAAVIILQSALDAERAKGERAGELVEVETVHDTHE